MLSSDAIRKLAPSARQDYVSALADGDAILDEYGINTPARITHFLAQICHETGGLTIVRENMNYGADRLIAVFPARYKNKPALAAIHAHQPKVIANFNYGFRMGNEDNGTDDDDGWRYRGGGLIQLTGKDNYALAGKAIGEPLGAQPELIENAQIALKAACWEFSHLLSYCDKGDAGLRAVCNGINRGNPVSSLDPIGWSDRQIWYSRAKDAVVAAGGVIPVDDMLSYGDHGAIVKLMQERLAALGYPIGRADGIFGSRTRSAVLTFQAENGLNVDGRVGAKTRAALNSDAAKPMPIGERADETAADLRAAGSETMKTASAVKTTASAAGTISAAVGATQGLVQASPATAPQVDLIKGTKDVVTEIGSWKAITSAISDTVAWATSHWWIFAIVVAFILYRWGSKIEFSRLKDHNLGFNLAR